MDTNAKLASAMTDVVRILPVVVIKLKGNGSSISRQTYRS